MGRGGGGARTAGRASAASRGEKLSREADTKAGTPARTTKAPTVHSLDRAFDASPGARDNFVRLDHFREALGGTRAEQDAAIRAGRLAGRFSLDSHEGLHESADHRAKRAAIHAAAIVEAGSTYVYISRR